MKLKHLFTLIFALFTLIIKAQSTDKEVLFTVADEPVYASEFIRVYNKNLDLVQDDSQKDVDAYLKLFTSYKLKLKEARRLGFDKKASYIKELDDYRKQLAKNYISDPQVTDALVEEAYHRTLFEVNANHILIKVSETASPEDTLVAYNKILKLRERALKEGFDKVREEVHNGNTVFGEKLGYFNAFKMVYNFESEAYNTKVGEISMPFRSRFGFHILKVLDKRKSEGEVEVAHIMIVKNEKDSLAEKPEVRINDIYKKIQQGEDFEALAKQFSDDKNSAPRGGKLPPFSRGYLRAKSFEDVAFGLDSIGEFSEPVKTNFGWHIIKLYAKHAIPDFETLKPELIGKVKRDTRSKLIDEALITKLKAKYNIVNTQLALDYFESIITDNYFKNSWVLPEGFKREDILLQIEDKVFTYQDFGDYLLSTMRNSRKKQALNLLITSKYESFLAKNLLKYQEDHLESENEEFAHIIGEYRDGLLLFALMEETIWNAAKSDSLGVQNYYDTHKADYILPERVDAVVASSSRQKTLKKVAKLLDQDMDLNQIKALINSNDKVEVVFTSGIMDSEHQALPANLEFKKGISKIYKHNDAFVLVQVKDILPSTQKTLEEAKGAVISDYQTNKEENWVAELASTYTVEINEAVLNKVKAQLK